MENNIKTFNDFEKQQLKDNYDSCRSYKSELTATLKAVGDFLSPESVKEINRKIKCCEAHIERYLQINNGVGL